MKRVVIALLVLLALAFAGSILVWPLLNDVETGRTPAYADLVPRSYPAAPGVVAKAAEATIAKLPGWRFVASGHGPGGHEIQAIATVAGFEHDVTIRVRPEGGATRVSVRSHSRVGSADFGQNARNIRAFLAQLDQQLR